MPAQFPVTGKHFIGLVPEDFAKAGRDPARQIVPAWFGFRAVVDALPESCPAEVTGRSQFKLFVNGKSILFGPAALGISGNRRTHKGEIACFQ